MEPATWTNCLADFAFDGALIDLLVPGTAPPEWEAFWAALRAGPFELRAFREGEPIPLPETAAWIFAELEEVLSEQAFESVLAVMRFVAAAVGLPVLAVAEGGTAEYAFLRVSSSGKALFLPAGSIKGKGKPWWRFWG